MNRRWIGVGAVVVSFSLAGAARGETPEAPEPAGAVALEAPPAPPPPPFAISASLDTYVSINPQRGNGNTGPNELRAFDTATNDFSFSYAELVVERKAEPIGFRLDLGVGPTADVVNATDTAAGMGYDLMRNVQQAYVAWQAAPKLTLRLGKMATHHGLEVIESQVNWNYSNGLLFSWAIPFTETGLAVNYAASSAVDLTFFLVNGLNNTLDGNDFKSPGLQAIVRPSSRVTLIGNYQAFNELPGAAGGLGEFADAVHVFDVIATVTPVDGLDLALNSDVVLEPSSDGIVAGVAGYARWQTTAASWIAGRAELLSDRRSTVFGLPGGEPADAMEVTATYSYAPAAGLLLRGEARLDRGLGGYRPFTDRDAMPTATQVTIGLGAVASI